MKEQINRYARGAFEYEPLSAKIEPEMIIATAKKNTLQREKSSSIAGSSCSVGYEGSICITEENGRELKGLVYSTNNRVKLMTDRFVGIENTIHYEVDVEGIDTGDCIEGSIIAVTNGGQRVVSYEFQVTAGSYPSQAGEISNLFQFANLARDNVNEALKIFADDSFPGVFLKDDLSMCKLRDELMCGSDIKTALEEFLIAVHKKSVVNISLDRDEMTLDAFDGEIAANVIVSKNVWGRISLDVDVDGDFIYADRTHITEQDFTGGKLEYRFYMKSSLLHGGMNLGRLTFSTPFEKKTLIVRVDNTKENARKLDNMFEKRNIVTLMRTYMNFRLNRISAGQWTAASAKALDELLRMDEDNPYCCLFMSQILITDNKANEAKYYLECARDEAVAGRERDEVLYCYYLYVSTLYNKDRAYAIETAQTVKDIYENGSSDWRILWILLYFDVEMSKNKSLKLLRIKEQFNKGMRSPALFLEACLILNEQPLLLRVLNDFEIHVLLYGCRENIVEERLLKQAAGLALNYEGKQRLLFRLLTQMYGIFEDDSVLEAICGILIRNGMKGSRYIGWYEKGIDRGIRVTRLFEYYLASRDMCDYSPLPKMVLLYFGYNNELDRRLRAYLYANIIKNKSENSQIYSNYSERIREFALEELGRGTADVNTGIILDEYMKKEMISSENAKGTARILFTYRISVENPSIKNVYVGHKELISYEKYPLENGCAYVAIYTDEPCICFEDGFGRLYKDTVEYRLERVYLNELLIKQLMPYMEQDLMLSLYFCEKSRSYKEKQPELISMYGRLGIDTRLQKNYRRQLVSQVIDYYYDNYEDEKLGKLLASQQSAGIFESDILNEVHKIKLIELLIIFGKYDDAYELLKEVSFEGINPKRALRLCDYMIDRFKRNEIDSGQKDRLVRLSYYVFSKGRISNTLLEFLNKYYNGSDERMLKLWETACENGVDAYELEERIICQLLFAGDYCEGLHRVFASYKDNGASERIVEAYIAYGSYMYFVKDRDVNSCVFEYIEAWLLAQRDVISLCRLALLKYYSTCEVLDDDRISIAHELVDEMTSKGYIFSFFMPFAKYFPLPYRIVDKTVAEYRANPEHRVVFHYAEHDSGQYTAVDMKNMYAGVFVKSFVLFHDDCIDYYITEETKNGELTTPKNILRYTNDAAGTLSCRFDRLNELIGMLEDNATDEAAAKAGIYSRLDSLVNDEFKII